MAVKRRRTSRRTSRSPRSSPGSSAGAVGALTALARALRRLGARWYLFGAQAVALHGAARATQDIDVTVLGDFELEALFDALARENITPRIDDATFLAEARVVPSVHRPSGWNIDVVRDLLGQLERAGRRRPGRAPRRARGRLVGQGGALTRRAPFG
jgi:hypothetical protein